MFATSSAALNACTLSALAACLAFGAAFACCPKVNSQYGEHGDVLTGVLGGGLVALLTVEVSGAAVGLKTEGQRAVAACFSYMLLVIGALISEDMDSDD